MPNHVKLREQIDSVLDMELTKQQMDKGTLEYEKYWMFVIDIMSKLCAPARDKEIEKLRSVSKDPVELFRFNKISLSRSNL